MGVTLKQINSTNTELSLIQSNTASALNSLQTAPFFGGNVITGINLQAGAAKQIPHGLGRTPQYWFLLDIDAQAYVWRTGWTDSVITLECTPNACNIILWVV